MIQSCSFESLNILVMLYSEALSFVVNCSLKLVIAYPVDVAEQDKTLILEVFN